MSEGWTIFSALATAVGSLATALAIIVALFQDRLRRLIFKEALHLEFAEDAPCFQRTDIPDDTNPASPLPCYAVRIRVRNCGRAAANEVQVFCRDAGRDIFVPANLRWSQRSELALNYIAPDDFSYFDLGYILWSEPNGALFKIATVTDIPGRHQMLQPGEHVLRITVSAKEGVQFNGSIRIQFAPDESLIPTSLFLPPSCKIDIKPYISGDTCSCKNPI